MFGHKQKETENKENKKAEKISFVSEDLAVPEVIVGEKKPAEEEWEEDGILYDTVAIPEYRPTHNKK